MLEVEITQVGPETTSYSNDSTKENAYHFWTVDGKVLSVQAMHPDWDDPTGRNVQVLLQINGASDAAGKAIQPGQRYLLFTYNYRDLDFEQRMLIAQDLMSDSRRGEEIDPRSLDIDGNIIRYADRKEIVEMTDGDGNPVPDDTPLYRDPVTGQEEPLYMDMFHTICVNVTDFSQPRMEFDWNEKTQNFEVSRVIHYDTDYDLASFTLLPDGVTAEELIASSPTWQKAVEAIRVSDHSVPVLAVNHLEAVADFASGRAQITQGRSISQDEYRDGAAVCLISESLSRESGLNVGDTLPLSLYEFDQDLLYSYLTEYNPQILPVSAGSGLPAGDGVYRHRPVSPEQRVGHHAHQFYPQQRVRAGEKRHLSDGFRRLRRLGDDDPEKRHRRPDGGPAEGKWPGRRCYLL